MRKSTPKIDDRRQLELFDIEREDPLLVYIRRLRVIKGAWLTYSLAEQRLYVGRERGTLPLWAITSIAPIRDRLKREVMRVEHGIIEPPEIERQRLEGGAELVRLPGRRNPALDPPIRQRRAGEARFDPGAA
jgi:hypothetical protein